MAQLDTIDEAKSKEQVSGFQDLFVIKALIAGGVCAFVAAGLNGFDVTKIRMQNQSNQCMEYTGMISGMLKIYKEEGTTGLAKGIYPSMWRELTYSSIRIGGYEPIRKVLTLDETVDAHFTCPRVKYASALLSGGIGSAICNPLDLVKTRHQASLPGVSPQDKATWSAVKRIHATTGWSGLYRGWYVTSCRAAVLTSAQLGSYDSIKNNLLIKHLGFEEGNLLHFVCAMTAGLITTTVTNPFDVVKTRYLSDTQGRYGGVARCIVDLYQTDGLRGFLKGWMPAYWRLGPHTVLALLLIEKIRTVFGLGNI